MKVSNATCKSAGVAFRIAGLFVQEGEDAVGFGQDHVEQRPVVLELEIVHNDAFRFVIVLCKWEIIHTRTHAS